MKKEESLYNCLIIKEQKDYFGDNQLLSFEEIIRTNLIYDINFMAQNIQKDEFSFSTIDDRRFFLNKKKIEIIPSNLLKIHLQIQKMSNFLIL
jgi:hypothetical protein